MSVAEVGQGYALLHVPGLYAAKVTLVPASKLPPEPPHATGAELASAAPGLGQQQVGQGEEEEEICSAQPAKRWRWLLLSFQLPANATQVLGGGQNEGGQGVSASV